MVSLNQDKLKQEIKLTPVETSPNTREVSFICQSLASQARTKTIKDETSFF